LYAWTDWNLIRELLRTSALKEGAVVAVGEWSPRERPRHKKTLVKGGTVIPR
jgi:hypothetical protein